MEEPIGVVHPEEVLGFFKRLGVAEELEGGKLHCRSCGATITAENFRAASREDQQLYFICNNERCFRRMVACRRD